MPEEVMTFFSFGDLQRLLRGEVAIVPRAALKGSEGRMRPADRKFDTLDVFNADW